MNKFILVTMLLFQAGICYCQTEPAPKKQFTAADYKSKSNDQLTGGCILAGIGAGLIVVGANMQSKATGLDFSGTGVEALGILAVGGSIPLFAAASRNHQRAKAMAVVIKPEQALCLQQQSFSRNLFPALSLKIRL